MYRLSKDVLMRVWFWRGELIVMKPQTVWCLIVIAVLCVAPSFATTATMTLTGPGQNGTLGNVYIGPYVATINNVPNVQVICGDFVDETYLNETWTVDVTSFPVPETVQYQQAAWLTLQLLNPPACGGTNCAGDIQYAIWQLFDPTAPQGQLTPFDYLQSKGLTTDLNSAQAFLTNSSLSANYSQVDYSRFSLYTPDLSYPITC